MDNKPKFNKRMYNTISLAPMVRMNTLPFRELCASNGADFVFTEEIIDRKLIWCKRVENKELGTIDFVSVRDQVVPLRIRESEKSKLILQIGSNNAHWAVKATELVQNDICGVDVNMGCPMKFSTSGGMGAALMNDLENAKTIMKALKHNFGHKISISCKIRVLDNFEETLNFITTLQNETGIDFISVHPRTKAEKS